VKVHRAGVAACLALAAALAAGCGSQNKHYADANNIGSYVQAGPLYYQLQVSRQLNPFTPEDSGYIKGLSTSEQKIATNQMWFGVFVWAQNKTDKTYRTTDKFDIVDTQGNVYKPLKLNPAVNPYVWTSEPLAPGTSEPNPNSTAGYGPTGGDELLFKLPAVGRNSIYDNRPLTLQIRSPSGQQVWATISLDL
jgi:hypothetical protein